MRPVSVFAKGPGSEIEQLRTELQGRWGRAVMVLLSLHGLSPSQIAELLDHPVHQRRAGIHHARNVTAYIKEHPRLELLYGTGPAHAFGACHEHADHLLRVVCHGDGTTWFAS